MAAFKKKVMPNSIRLSFPAAFGNIDEAAGEIKKFLVQKNLEEVSFETILALREALINAVEYGSGSNPDKIVNLELRIERSRLIMEIEDQGPGFDWQSRLGKALPDRETSGRGLYIMKTYCDGILYNKAGNRLTLVKSIKPTGGNYEYGNSANSYTG